MEAFIPVGTSLSSRTFLTGDTAIAQSRRGVHARPVGAGASEISAIKLPNFLGFGKKETAAPTVAATPPKSVSLTVGDSKVVPTQEKRQPATGSKFEQVLPKLPKFYNFATARHQFSEKAAGQCATAFDVRTGFSGVKPGSVRENDQGGFRNMDLYTDDLVWARPGWSSDEARAGVRVAVRNVFGNANLFESELDELAYSISCVRETADMREFVRALGLSNGYRKRFFESCSNMRFIELNFKHFLGRAPHNQAEVSAQIQILVTQGYNASINAMIDSEEYNRLFGRSRIPAVNFRGGHPYNCDMNKTAVLNGSYLASDRVSTKAFLETGDSSTFSAFSVSKGLPEAWRGENKARNDAGPLMAFPDTIFWNLPPPAMQKADSEWTMRYGTKFWYKDSIVYEEVMTPNLTHSKQEEEEAAAILKYGSLMSKTYVGSRKSFNMAPVLSFVSPTNVELSGRIELRMETIEATIPKDLVQAI